MMMCAFSEAASGSPKPNVEEHIWTNRYTKKL